MNRVVKVKFRNSSRVYFFDALDFDIKKGDCLIVETARGNMLGEAVAAPEETPSEKLVAPLKPVIRLAVPDDIEQQKLYQSKEAEAAEICRKKIEEHGLEMKLVDVEYAYNGSKLTFYFTADNRVDFRELLKDLTSIFKTRIDLRQIGDRDEAKKCGGLGFCGRPICCNTFLNDFTPVSIKMAKSQNLSLNPVKISGICGKLMCCLRYEYDSYESMQKIMPKAGKEFITPDGVGIVLENNIITETTKVKVTLADGTLDVRSYPFRELQPNTGAAAPQQETDKPQETVEDSQKDEMLREENTDTETAEKQESTNTDSPDIKRANPNEQKKNKNNQRYNNRPNNKQQNDKAKLYHNKGDQQRNNAPNQNNQPKKDTVKPRQVY